MSKGVGLIKLTVHSIEEDFMGSLPIIGLGFKVETPPSFLRDMFTIYCSIRSSMTSVLGKSCHEHKRVKSVSCALPKHQVNLPPFAAPCIRDTTIGNPNKHQCRAAGLLRFSMLSELYSPRLGASQHRLPQPFRLQKCAGPSPCSNPPVFLEERCNSPSTIRSALNRIFAQIQPMVRLLKADLLPSDGATLRTPCPAGVGR